jgi:hypothetical protein
VKAKSAEQLPHLRVSASVRESRFLRLAPFTVVRSCFGGELLGEVHAEEMSESSSSDDRDSAVAADEAEDPRRCTNGNRRLGSK